MVPPKGDYMKQIVDTLIQNTIEVDHKLNTQQFNEMMVSHYHPSYEIYYLIEGERMYFVKDQTYIIKKGNFAFIPPNVIHKTLTTTTYAHERILISFTADFLDPLIGQLSGVSWYNLFDATHPIVTVPISKGTLFQDMMFKILGVYQEQKSDSHCYIQLLVLELLLLLNRHHEESTLKIKQTQTASQRKTYEIVRYINENFMRDLSLNTLSQRFFISPFYLSHIFKDATGFSLSEYIIQLRILEAKKLLSQTNHSMTRVAELVGFDSSTHFGRTFKKVTTMTPRDYKKAVKLD